MLSLFRAILRRSLFSITMAILCSTPHSSIAQAQEDVTSLIQVLEEVHDITRKGQNPSIGTILNLRQRIQSIDVEEVVAAYDERELIEQRADKVFYGAADLEALYKLLDRTGLRGLLKKLGSQEVEGSMSWFAHRDPLPSKPVGQGTGETAAQLRLRNLKYTAQSRESFKSIVRSQHPNFFETGEHRGFHEGVRVRTGKLDQSEIGYFVELVLDPNARDGTDFKVIRGEYNEGLIGVLILNRDAVEVVRRPYVPRRGQSLYALFRTAFSGAINAGEFYQTFDELLEKGLVEDQELDKIYDYVQTIAQNLKGDRLSGSINAYNRWNFILNAWFQWPVSARYPQLIDQLFQYDSSDSSLLAALSYEHMADLANYEHWVKEAMNLEGALSFVLSRVLSKPFVLEKHPQLLYGIVDQIMNSGNYSDRSTVVDYLLSQPHMTQAPRFVEWIDMAIVKGHQRVVIESVLNQRHMFSHPKYSEWISKALPGYEPSVIRYIFTHPQVTLMGDYMDWVRQAKEARPEWPGPEGLCLQVLAKGAQ